jgi:negative regulator of sigma-B (phosphoserine phosphatase)
MPLIETGVAAAISEGQAWSGDLYLVKTFSDGALVAAVDGLGHGDEAAAVAKTAIAVLESHPLEPLVSLLRRCHESLRLTRGVVMSLASFNAREETMTWLGVGDVEGVLWHMKPKASRQAEYLLLRGGVVGCKIPSLHASTFTVARGDTLIFATDGIENDFARDLTPSDPPQRMADQIIARHRKGKDDALVLVARYVGCRP